MVGGGIAGCGAAWALHRAGVDVELFEAAAVIGGNAKTHDWPVDGGTVTTGLSVLAWPRALFRNYRCLLATLGVATQQVELRCFIRKGEQEYAQGRDSALAHHYAGDLIRWRRLVALVRGINHVFNGFPRRISLYRLSPLNPLNLVPLARLARVLGISRGFWDDIVVPFYSATFLTTKMDRIPAVILPIIDEILPIDRPGQLDTWRDNSAIVFTRLTQGFAEHVHTNCAITGIEPDREGVTLTDQHGVTHRFDKVVLACPAPAVAQALRSPRWLHGVLMRDLGYCDDHDPTFVDGVVHTDPTVIPERDRNEVLAGYCNYILVTSDADGAPRYENHFVLSAWVPAARGAGVSMLVYYNKPKTLRLTHQQRVISNRRAHPDMSTGNLARALGYRFLQGKDGLYYCGSCATPGNGHDLSLLSGLVIAAQLGGSYPFSGDPEARADFLRLRRIMLGRLA